MKLRTTPLQQRTLLRRTPASDRPIDDSTPRQNETALETDHLSIWAGTAFWFYLAILVVLGMNILEQTSLAQSPPLYDEAKLPSYTLPELLVGGDESQITSPEQWVNQRRPELLNLFKRHVFGTMPEQSGQHQVVWKAKVARDVIASFGTNKPGEPVVSVNGRLREISLTLSRRPQSAAAGRTAIPQDPNVVASPVKAIRLNLLIVTPAVSKGAVPVFLAYNFLGNHTIDDSDQISLTPVWVPKKKQCLLPPADTRGSRSSRWPVGLMLSRGYGLVTLNYGEVDPDFDDQFANGVHAFFPELQKRPDNWSTIGAWAWGLHRVMDFLEQDEAVDQQAVIVFGHSRLGKTSLWTGATDSRFAGVIANNSGCGGAALSRRRFGESVARINQVFPHWFCRQHRQYNNNEDASPVDHHMLIALVAPRPVYIASAQDDRWADPRGEHLSAFHAGPAYRLFGRVGLGQTSPQLPECGKPIGQSIRYHIRTGKHDVTRFDWQQYLDFADDLTKPAK